MIESILKSVSKDYCITTLSPGDDVNGYLSIRLIGLLNNMNLWGDSLHSIIKDFRNDV